MLKKKLTLANGVEIPALALGTWQIDDDTVEGVVHEALDVGYRHIDTAVQYENEAGIGRSIRAAGVNRDDVFVTTKIPHDVKTYDGTAKTIDESLTRFGFDYVDLLLIHAPKPWPEMFAGSEKTYFEENLAVWQAMIDAYHAGKAHAIGVSNFEEADLRNLMENSSVAPMVDQFRVHIGHTPAELIRFCQQNGIVVEAFSPNATGKLFDKPEIAAMAQKYGVSVPQLSIRYDIQLGVLPLPKSTHRNHMIQNAQVDFQIAPEDMEALGQVPEIQSLDEQTKHE